MKKIAYIVLVFILMFSLISCTNGGSMMFFNTVDYDQELIESQMEQLFKAVKHQNRDEIRQLLSKNAIKNSKNIDEDIEIFLNFVQGSTISWEYIVDGCPIIGEAREDGKLSKQLEKWYLLKTDKQSYMIYLIYSPYDEIDPENKGLCSIVILQEEDNLKLEHLTCDWVPGITVLAPSEDDSLVKIN